MLARQTAELEAVHKQLSKHVEFARQLQILSRQSEGIWDLPPIHPSEPPKPAEPASAQPAPPFESASKQTPSLEHPLRTPSPAEESAEAKIAALRNQLMEQTENLRRAHETIRLLREQKQTNDLPVSSMTTVPAADNSASPEISWTNRPAAERQTRAAVWQFLEEQEVKGYQKQTFTPKPAPVAVPPIPATPAKPAQPAPAQSAPAQQAPAQPAPAQSAPAQQAPAQQAPAQQAEPDEKTKSLFRKFGLLGGWSAGK